MLRSTSPRSRRNVRSLSAAKAPVAVFEALERRVLMSQGPLAGEIIPQITGTAVSTVPANGDGNPYGVAYVPNGFPSGGALHAGDLLVSNFNSSAGLQGTGTTIVRVDNNQHVSTFYQGPAGLGLTTALGVLSRGYVVVGNFPSTDGTVGTATPGSLIILNKNGQKVFQISGSFIDGPWDMAIDDEGATAHLYVSNALSGTVTRVDLSVPNGGSNFVVTDHDTIASGYAHHADPVGFVQGPTGLVFEKSTDTLLVASTADNKIYSVSNAGTRETSGGKGSVLYQDNAHLRGPLGMIAAPNGDLIVANSDLVNADSTQTSEYVEFTSTGHFVGQYSVDAAPGGAFGLAVKTNGQITTFAAVDDNLNDINFWTVESPTGDPTGGVPFGAENGQIIPQITGRTFNTNSPAGDTNPYGVAFVPGNIAPGGVLHPGNILVSNFNSNSGLQGTGTTVMRVNSNGDVSTFYKGFGLGLTTALTVLQRGYVIVGNMPTTDGTAATAKAGSLLILNNKGELVYTLTSKKYIDGPWDMTVLDQGATATLFVSNVLSGTVSRIVLSVPTSGNNFHVVSESQIASGYAHRADSAALVVGPTGLAYDPISDNLFVASTDDNAIYVVPLATHTHTDNGKGSLVYKDNAHLRGPLGLTLLPNGDLITANSDAINPDSTQTSEYVEFNQSGHFIDQFQVDPNAGGAFGLASEVVGDDVAFAAVNDNQGTLTLWHFEK